MQAALQYRTSSHVFAHFLRHANGRAHAAQTFVGRFVFFTPRIVRIYPAAAASTPPWARPMSSAKGARSTETIAVISAASP